MSDESPRVVTIEELVAALSLTGITFYEAAARLFEDGKREGFDGDTESQLELHSNWGVRIRHLGKDFGVRLRVELEMSRGDVVVDVASEYEMQERLTIPRDVAYEFVNNVALMQLYPYIREAVSSMTARVFGQTQLLPVFERGEVAFDGGPDGPAFSDGSGDGPAAEE